MTSATLPTPADHTVPQAPAAVWVERLLWVFMMSFALDYRASIARESGAGAGLDQLVFLALATGSSLGILLLGWPRLVIRPGAWILLLWGAFLTYMLANAFLQGVPPGRSLRIILPLFLCFAGMINAHIAGCMGISPSRIVMPVLVASCTNVCWRIAHGFLGKGVTIETVRTQVQSPASNWIAAWIGCAILLRPKFHPSLLIAIAVLFTGIFITVTRSLLFPIAASAIATSACYLLGIRWGLFSWQELPRRILPITAATTLVLFGVGFAALASPTLVSRWNERLFHHSSDRNIKEDISVLTRKAEAEAIIEILDKDPVHYLHGHGIGASYYWSSAYLPEIHQVFPKEEEIGIDIWFAGHSVWTYALFAGGILALIGYLSIIFATMIASLRCAHANATDPGPDQWLAFLPFVAACCLLSESATSNPFDERLAGITFGIMAGLPQAFMVRASWLHTFIRPSPQLPS